jgi:heptosyltransferase-2
VLLIGAPDERRDCDAIADAAGLPSTENLAGELSLGDLLALISIASRVISNDSAPLHLAESVGTPVTAIFGPTVPELGFGPIGERSGVVQIDGLACRPCRIHGSDRCPIGTHECMTRITTDVLLAALGPGR